MPYETILTDISENIFTITINRPEKLNALNTQMIHDLIAAFDEADADDAVRAIIVTGAGRAFCAGADLSTGAKTFDRAARPDRPQVPDGPDGKPDLSHENARDGGGRITLRIFNCRKPVIAAVNGPAVGIGVTMQLPMDVRIASTDARFGFVFSQRGIVPEAASSWFLPRIVGIAQALDWCYSGRVFGADEALKGGLVSRVVAPGELIETARTIARGYAEKTSAVSVAVIRQMMWRMLGAAHPMEAHRIDSRAMFHRGRGADVKEGIASFLEKRPARFTDTVSATCRSCLGARSRNIAENGVAALSTAGARDKVLGFICLPSARGDSSCYYKDMDHKHERFMRRCCGAAKLCVSRRLTWLTSSASATTSTSSRACSAAATPVAFTRSCACSRPRAMNSSTASRARMSRTSASPSRASSSARPDVAV